MVLLFHDFDVNTLVEVLTIDYGGKSRGCEQLCKLIGPIELYSFAGQCLSLFSAWHDYIRPDSADTPFQMPFCGQMSG